ncbi:MAG: ATP synthase F1 subunit gamma [Candidatus Moraniibacteriota bacterium]
MAGTREIRRRIKSVKNTGKITRAMEMISSVKMRKAAAQVAALRPYAKSAWDVLSVVSRARDVRDAMPLLTARPVKKQLFVVVTSNRGLCGSFNTQIFRRLRTDIASIRSSHAGAEIEFVSLGRKGDTGLKLLVGSIIASFPDVVASPTASEVRSIAKFLFEGFEPERWDCVSIVYTDFVSALVQKVRVHQVLPFFERDAEEQIAEMGGENVAVGADVLRAEYTVEPAPETVLRSLLFRLVEMQVLHAVLESNASQEAARMVAMRNASDAAKDMTESFTLLYNQLRQAKVTQEIAELSAGMAAVS